jgi:hypothetical protein
MNIIKHKNMQLLLLLISFGFALYTQVIWGIVAAVPRPATSDTIPLFLEHFPVFLSNIKIITYLTLACAITAFLLSLHWTTRERGVRKAITITIAVLAVVITFLTLFQLM